MYTDKINKNGKNLINIAGKEYRDEIKGIKEEIEMYEFQLTQSKDPHFTSFCKDKIERLKSHIEDLEGSIKELREE